MGNRIKQYFAEVRGEFRHISWPSREEAFRLTGVVIALSLGVSLFLGAFDAIFAYILKYFLIR